MTTRALIISCIFIIFFSCYCNADTNGLYIIKKNGEETLIEEKPVYFCKLVKKRSSYFAVMDTQSTPLIVYDYTEIPYIYVDDIDCFKIVGKIKGDIKFNIGTTEDSWINKWDGQVVLMKGKRSDSTDMDNWVAHPLSFKYPFLIQNINSDVSLYKFKDSTKSIILGKKGINFYAKRNMPLAIFIWESVQGRRIDRGWVFVLEYSERIKRIKNIQQLLKENGFEPGTIDGLFGEKTKNSIKKFQQENNIVVDGKPSIELYNTLQVKFTKNQIHDVGKSQTNAYDTKLVKTIQSKLYTLELYNGFVDGHFNKILKNSIIEFQKRKKLQQTGFPSEDLLKEIENHMKQFSTELQVKEALNLFDQKKYKDSFYAFDSAFKSKNYSNKFNNEQIRYYNSHQFVNIGMIAAEYYSKQQYEKSIEWYQKSLSIVKPTFEFAFDKYYISNIFFLSMCYVLKSDTTKGKKYYKMGLNLLEDSRLNPEDRRELKELSNTIASSNEFRNMN